MISVDLRAPVLLSSHPQITEALKAFSPLGDGADPAATDGGHAGLCVQVFDRSSSPGGCWTVLALQSDLRPCVPLSGAKPEVLLRAWTPQRSLSDSECLDLAADLYRLYGVRHSDSGAYEHKRPISPTAPTPGSKRLRLSADPLPGLPVGPQELAHALRRSCSSPGPSTEYSTTRLYAPLPRRILSLAQPLPPINESLEDLVSVVIANCRRSLM